MRIYLEQTSFPRGEISGRLHNYSDLDHYRLGLAEASNMIVLRHGGLQRRPPTEFIYEIKDSSKKARLSSFTFSSEQAYILEWGDNYMRPYKDGGIILDGGVPVEIATPYDVTEAQEFGHAQSNDVLYMAHKSYHPRRMSRTSHVDWTIDNVVFADGPWGPKNGSGTKATPDGVIIANEETDVTFDRAAGINDGAGFSASDVGRYFRYEHPGENTDLGYTAPTTGQHVAWGQITGVTDSTTITVLWLGTAGITSKSGVTLVNNIAESEHWWLGAFYTTDTYPHRVGFYSSRLAWARSNSRPQTIWMSRTGSFEAYDVSDRDGVVQDDHAITSTIDAGQVNEIQWLVESSVLQIGTKTAMRSISSVDGEALSPNNRKQRRESTYGASDLQPVQVGSATLYVSNYGKELREGVYSFETDGFITPDASILSEHLLRSGVVQMAYAQSPNSLVWLVTGDGSLVSLTYERDQRTVGWCSHDVGGFVESVAAIPGSDRDEVWLIVRREIDGVTKRYVERLKASFDIYTDDLEDYAHLDCQSVYDGAATSTLSGLDYVEGETLGVMADGIYIGTAEVSGGALTLPLERSASKIIVGIPYTSRAKTLTPPLQGRDGSLRGRKIRVQEVMLSYLGVVDLTVGTQIEGLDRLERLLGDEFTDDKAEKPELLSGQKRVKVDDSWDNQGQIVFQVETTYPAIIRSIQGGYEYEP